MKGGEQDPTEEGGGRLQPKEEAEHSSGADDETTSSAKGVGRKRLIDETTLNPTDRKKLESRRAYNRHCAAKARKRSKELVTQLQGQVEELIKEKAELKRNNEVMKAQLDLLEQQNRVLITNQVNVGGMQQQQQQQQQTLLGGLGGAGGNMTGAGTSNALPQGALPPQQSLPVSLQQNLQQNLQQGLQQQGTSQLQQPSLSLIDRLTLERLAAQQNSLVMQRQTAQGMGGAGGAFGNLDANALNEVLGLGNSMGAANNNNAGNNMTLNNQSEPRRSF